MAVPIWARNHLTPSSGLQHPSALGAMPPAKAPPVAKGGGTAKANAERQPLFAKPAKVAKPGAAQAKKAAALGVHAHRLGS